MVVNDWDDLDRLGDEGAIRDKIVLYNYKWDGYSNSVQYRVNGANRAKEHGAIGVLIKSIASKSIETVHTGMQNIEGNNKTCAAAISIEDAEMMQRMKDRG